MIVARVRRTLVDRDLAGPGDKVLVACSGGPDSVAMTHALGRLAEPLGLSLIVATVDHGLRGDVSAEVSLVEDLAATLSLPFRALRVKVASEGSLQGNAREARYAALLDLGAREGATRVAVGHSLDDQAETVLDRLLRGASVRGLSGIAPRREDGVIRPLIDVRRTEVLGHLAHHGLEFITDPSNDDARFTRVRIRRGLLPALAAEDPAIARHLAELADDARATRALVDRAGAALLAAAGRPRGLDAPTLAAGEAAARRAALRSFLGAATGCAPRRSHLLALDHLVLRGGAGEVRLPHQLVARLDGNKLVVEERREPRGSSD